MKKYLYLIIPLLFIVIVFSFKYFDIIFNNTPSTPIGFYKKAEGNISTDDYIAFCLDEKLTAFGLSRGYLEKCSPCQGSKPLIKKVIAIPRDTITVTKNFILTKTQLYNLTTLNIDSSGRYLYSIKNGNYKENCYWVIGDHDSLSSWDSRYWGCISKAQILYKVTPLLIWN